MDDTRLTGLWLPVVDTGIENARAGADDAVPGAESPPRLVGTASAGSVARCRVGPPCHRRTRTVPCP